MTDLALLFDHVSYDVPTGFWHRNRRLVDGLHFEMMPGQVLGLVGPNGAGKTTTIKLAAGLVSPSVGRVEIKGQSSTRAKARQCIGMVTENQYIYLHLKLREWLTMMGGLSGLKGQSLRSRVSDMLAQIELEKRADQMMHTLSKGQLQRAGIAQAMIHQPDILILDEPMSGLDPYWRFRLLNMLRQFRLNGGTILFSSNILVDVERLSDMVALIHDGRIRWMGRFSDMPRKIKAYEIICRTEAVETLRQLAHPDDPVQQPKGGWAFTIPVDRKEKVLSLSSIGVMDIESMHPVREEIEEVLFGFGYGEE